MKSIVTDQEMNIKEVFVQVGDPDKEHKEMGKNVSSLLSENKLVVSQNFHGNTGILMQIYFHSHIKGMDSPRRFSI